MAKILLKALLVLVLFALQTSGQEKVMVCRDIWNAPAGNNSEDDGSEMFRFRGPPGEKGEKGDKGDQGLRGLPGAPGTPATVNYDRISKMIDGKIRQGLEEMNLKVDTLLRNVTKLAAAAQIVKRAVEKTTKIRLRGGSTLTSGRVEVYYSKSWGTICHDSFDMNDAHVACKQLGFNRASSYYGNAHFGQGNGRIWLDNLACNGGEDSLWNCEGNAWGSHDCSHSKDVGVACVT